MAASRAQPARAPTYGIPFVIGASSAGTVIEWYDFYLYATLAPIILVTLRLLQGLALGGEYGGAAIYVAEHSPDNKRGLNTAWIQTTATIGFFAALLVILLFRTSMSAEDFARVGWRYPFVISVFLLLLAFYIRVRLQETPLFARLKARGQTSSSTA